MKCYNISEPIIKTWRNNKNIKEKVKNLNIQSLQNIVDKFKFIFKDLVLSEDLNTNLQIIEARLNTINNYSEFEFYLKIILPIYFINYETN